MTWLRRCSVIYLVMLMKTIENLSIVGLWPRFKLRISEMQLRHVNIMPNSSLLVNSPLVVTDLCYFQHPPWWKLTSVFQAEAGYCWVFWQCHDCWPSHETVPIWLLDHCIEAGGTGSVGSHTGYHRSRCLHTSQLRQAWMSLCSALCLQSVGLPLPCHGHMLVTLRWWIC